MQDYNSILKEVESLKNTVTEHRRKIHQIAEVGFSLSKTSEYITDVLDGLGLKYKRCGKGGIVCEIGSGSRAVLLRADMDALPMDEQSGEEFASSKNSHSCGHDMHTAMLLGAMELICKYRYKIQGRIVFCFQPAEELLLGAKDMIDDGLLAKYNINRAFSIHVLSGVDFPVGTFLISSASPAARESAFFNINVNGYASHGALPHLSNNALACGIKIAEQLEEIPVRCFSFTEGLTISIGSLSGGNASNAIADRTEISGTLRCYEHSTMERAMVCMQRALDGVSSIYECNSTLNVTSECPALINDNIMVSDVRNIISSLYGNDKAIIFGDRGDGGSEDFAFISQAVPSLMISLSAGCREDGFVYPLHNPKVRFDERALEFGTALFACVGIYYAEKESDK